MENPEKKILIINPDHDERAVMAAFLQSDGFQINSVKGLVEAVKIMSGENFPLLILDVDIPEMKGYEAVSLLKNIDPRVKIIITSKHNTKELEAKIREQDIFFYYIKSFGKEEFKLAVQSALNSRDFV
jgi:DNA-binding NtrC family response regulator